MTLLDSIEWKNETKDTEKKNCRNVCLLFWEKRKKEICNNTLYTKYIIRPIWMHCTRLRARRQNNIIEISCAFWSFCLFVINHKQNQIITVMWRFFSILILTRAESIRNKYNILSCLAYVYCYCIYKSNDKFINKSYKLKRRSCCCIEFIVSWY